MSTTPLSSSSTTTTATSLAETIPSSSPFMTITQWCVVISVVCCVWNLIGDLYYLDLFWIYTDTQRGFAVTPTDTNTQQQQVHPNIFSKEQLATGYIGYLAQAGSWMYPIWALCLVLPLFPVLLSMTTIGNGNNNKANGRLGVAKATIPCVLLLYGICIIGGSLHSAVAFLTVLPIAYDNGNGYNLNDDNNYNNNTDQFDPWNSIQTELIKRVFWGTFPGIVATNIASIWIGWIVQWYKHTTNRPTSSSYYLPRSFNWFNPIVTTIWISVVSIGMLPPTVAYYVSGCLGTWGMFMLTVGTAIFLGGRRSKNTNINMYYDGPERIWNGILHHQFLLNPSSSSSTSSSPSEEPTPLLHPQGDERRLKMEVANRTSDHHHHPEESYHSLS